MKQLSCVLCGPPTVQIAQLFTHNSPDLPAPALASWNGLSPHFPLCSVSFCTPAFLLYLIPGLFLSLLTFATNAIHFRGFVLRSVSIWLLLWALSLSSALSWTRDFPIFRTFQFGLSTLLLDPLLIFPLSENGITCHPVTVTKNLNTGWACLTQKPKI